MKGRREGGSEGKGRREGWNKGEGKGGVRE